MPRPRIVAFAALVAAVVAAVVATPRARAERTEIVASAGVSFPVGSQYRAAAEALGYDRRSLRHVYEFEVGALRSLAWWISVGPFARVYAGRLGAPYEGVEPIDTWGASLAARVEIELHSWPRIFAWADPSIGLGSIGVPGARQTLGYWGYRGGLGFATARDATALRFRVGYGNAPTFDNVTVATGRFDYGGILVLVDGVLRVAE